MNQKRNNKGEQLSPVFFTFDFCSSQGYVTSTDAKPVLASTCNWPL